MEMYGKHSFHGRLFIVEGIDGSGKSTQLSLLHRWLESEGYAVVFSEWNSSPLVKNVTRRGKKKMMLTPMTFSLIHATDFADRTEHPIIPPLKAGSVVLADRYAYMAFARDVARGIASPEILLNELQTTRLLLAELATDRSRQSQAMDKIFRPAIEHSEHKELERKSLTPHSSPLT